MAAYDIYFAESGERYGVLTQTEPFEYRLTKDGGESETARSD
jgi:hypothetical protein